MKKLKEFIKKNPAFAVFLILALLLCVSQYLPRGSPPTIPMRPCWRMLCSPPAPSTGSAQIPWKGSLFPGNLRHKNLDLAAALALVGIIMTAGTFLGIVAGYFGGVLDA